MRVGGAAAGILSALFLTAACVGGSSDDAAKAMPEAGQCLSGEIRDLDTIAPDVMSVVDCTKKHVYEVVDVVDVPKRFLKGTTEKERTEQRNTLAKLAGDGPLKTEFWDYATDQCTQSRLASTGLSKLHPTGKNAKQARVDTVFGGAVTAINLTGARSWSRGDARVICTIRFTTHISAGRQADSDPITSSSALPTFRSLLTSAFPADRRQCVNYDSLDYRHFVPCSKAHYGEVLFSYDARSVFGEKFVLAVDEAEELSDAQWDRLNTPCLDAMPALLGADYDDELASVVDLVDGAWENAGDLYPAYCIVSPLDDKLNLPPGSVLGMATDVDFRPGGQGSRA